jgi:hypothetical protein
MGITMKAVNVVVFAVAAAAVQLAEARVRTGSVTIVDDNDDTTSQGRRPLDSLMEIKLEIPMAERKKDMMKYVIESYNEKLNNKESPTRDPYPKTSTTLGSATGENGTPSKPPKVFEKPTFSSTNTPTSKVQKSSKASDVTTKSTKASDSGTNDSENVENPRKSTKAPKSDSY